MTLTRTHRWLIGVAAALMVYALAGFLLAPWLTGRILTGTLQERLNLATTVEDLRINPFTFTLAVDGLAITEVDGEPLVSFDALFVNFELVSLFRWAYSFDEFHLDSPRVHLERTSENRTNVGDLLDRWSASAEPQSEPEPAPESSEDGGLIRLTVGDLRINGGSVTFTDQSQTEPFTTELAPIDLFVTDLSTLPDSSGTQQVIIHTESGASIGWTGELGINPLSVAGDVEVQGTYTPMLFRYFQEELALPVGFEGGELDARFAYRLTLDDAGTLHADINRFEGTLAGFQVTQPGFPPLLSLGALKVSGGRLAWPEQTMSIGEVGFDDVVVDAYLRQGDYFEPATGSDTEAPDPPEATHASTRTDADAETSADDADAANAEGGGAGGSSPNVYDESWSLRVERIRLGNWQINHTDTSLENGRLTLYGINAELTNVSNQPGGSVDWQLAANLEPGGGIAATGRLQFLPDLDLTAELSGMDLALGALQPYVNTVANIAVASGGVSLQGTLASRSDLPYQFDGNVRINGLELIDRAYEEPLLKWQSLTLDQLSVTAEAIALSELRLAAPYARIQVKEDGTTNIQRTLLSGEDTGGAAREDAEVAATEAPAAASDETAAAAPPAFTLGKVTISDGSASFTDLALPLPFDGNLSALSGTITTLTSASTEPARVDIEGQVNEYGQITIKGSLQPFSPAAGTDIAVRFENVEVPRMSPYTIKFAGRRIDDGRTDLDIRMKLANGELEGSNHLVVRDLKLGEKVPQPGAMDLPLDLAVALLKDADGNVDFEFPVSGTLGDPEFSYGGAVMKAFSNVILGLATSPFRLLGSLVGRSADELDRVGFVTGESELRPPEREVLDELVTALTQRPQLILAITPAYDPKADRDALAQAAVDAEIDAALAEASEDAFTERRRRVIESLYDAAALAPTRDEVRSANSPAGEDGQPVFDELAYTEALRTALIESRAVGDAALAELADARVSVISAELTEAGLDADRILAETPTEVRAKDGEINLALSVDSKPREVSP